MDIPWQKIKEEIPRQLEETEKYLGSRQITSNDILVLIHSHQTGWPDLPNESIDHLIRISSLARAFDQMNGRIVELAEGSIGLNKFLELAGVSVKIFRTYQTSPFGWEPDLGKNGLSSELGADLSGNGRVLLAGSYLWDNGKCIPSGCVGRTWEFIALSKGLPSGILKDYCFQYGCSSYHFSIDDWHSIKPNKTYPGCI